jgi:UDP-N-acetylmuramate dehydrogenase
MNKYERFKNEFGKPITENEKLAKYTTFKIGGSADLFYVAENTDNLVKAVKLAIKYKIPYILLGQGSNVLVSDSGYKGLVIKNNCQYFKIKDNKVIASSGAKLFNIVRHCVERNLGGIEFLANIPGTIGGATYGNAGVYKKDNKKSIADVLIEAKLLTLDGKIKKVKKEYFDFGYRTSKLKKTKEIVLEVTLKCRPKNKHKILQLIKKDLNQRVRKYPPYPFAGSFFKNVTVDSADFKNIDYKELIKKFGGQIPAGYLVDKAGLVGKKIGGAMVSEEHGNFIVNTGNAKACDVKKLAQKIKKEVYDKFGVKLEEEIQFLPESNSNQHTNRTRIA